MADFSYQYLKHGKALCGAVFGTFVETFNRLVSRAENMKGDKETGDGAGYITVDNADPDHPVIRFDASKLKSADEAAYDFSASAFGLKETKDDEGEVTSRSVVNCWWNVGGVTHTASDQDIGLATGVIYAKFEENGTALTIGAATDAAALNELQYDVLTYVVPLYMIDAETGAASDLRTAPQIQMFEGGLS